MTAGAPIVAVRWTPYAVPFTAPVQTAAGTWTAREGFIVEVRTADGARSFGEAAPLSSPDAATSLTACSKGIGSLARALLGMTPRDAWQRLCSARGPAAFAVETAIASHLAAEDGLPLAHWLGREWDSPNAPSETTIPVNATLDDGEPDALAAAARAAVAAGFRTIKLKVGGARPAGAAPDALTADLARVRAVASAAGPEVALRVDANGAWDEETAARFLAAVAREVALCEQPVAPGPEAASCLARLRSASSVSVAADESCRTVDDLRLLVAAGAIDAVVLKPALTGLHEALAMLALALREGIPVIVTSVFEAGLGTVAAAHLAALLPAPPPACGLATLDRLAHPLVIDAPRVEAGFLRLPQRPGLGVSVDEDALARFASGPVREVCL